MTATIICVFEWCIVVGIVLSLTLNYIIDAPQQSYASLSTIIFITGALGLVFSLSAFKLFKKHEKCRLITHIIFMWTMAATILVAAILLILTSKNQMELFIWIDTSLREMFQNGSQTIKGIEAVFLIENQLSCCGFNGTSYYPSDSLTVGCCDSLEIRCTVDVAHKKACRTAFMEMVRDQFEDFGVSLVFADLIILAAILNSCILLAKMGYDEKMDINI